MAEYMALVTHRDQTDYLNGPRTIDGRAWSFVFRLATRHPLVTTAFAALVMVWVTIGLVYRVAAAQHTVASGWAAALAAGLVIGGAPVVVIGLFMRQPRSRPTIGACFVVLALAVAGLFLTEPLIYRGFLPTSYVITSPLQVAALAWLIPVVSPIAALLVGVLLFFGPARRAGLRRTRGSAPALPLPAQDPEQDRGRA
jgi:phosphoglycerol transferase MdoB-like AlkP superfamily enzyme